MITRILALVLVLGGLAMAQDTATPDPPPLPPPPMHMGGPEHSPEMEHHGFSPHQWWKNADTAQKVGLSETQVQKLDQLALEHRLKAIDLRAALEREEVRLEPLMEAANPDESQIMSQIDKLAAQRGQLEKSDVQFRLAVRRVLTPEQLKKFQSIKPHEMEMNHFFVRSHGDGGPRVFIHHSEAGERSDMMTEHHGPADKE